MEKSYIINILGDLISGYLCSDINKEQIYLQLLGNFCPTDIVEQEDELLNDSYFAIYHMNEKFCEVTDDEFQYLKDCLNGKYRYSRAERDRILHQKNADIV